MMKKLLRIVTFTLLAHLTASAANAGQIDLGVLLAEMLDRTRVTEFPLLGR